MLFKITPADSFNDLRRLLTHSGFSTGLLEQPSILPLLKFLNDKGTVLFSRWDESLADGSNPLPEVLQWTNSLYNSIGNNLLLVVVFELTKRAFDKDNDLFAERFAWICISTLKMLKGCPRSDRDTDDVKELTRRVAAELSRIDLRKIGEKTADKLSPIILHYAVTILGKDDELPALYEKAKQNYLAKRSSYSSYKNFGWILHDCITRAFAINNPKLIRFFKSELESFLPAKATNYKQELSEEDQKYLALSQDSGNKAPLEEVIRRDIEKASAYSFETGRVQAFIDNKEWDRALEAAGQLLEESPHSPSAKELLVKAYAGFFGQKGRWTTKDKTPTEHQWRFNELLAQLPNLKPGKPNWNYSRLLSNITRNLISLPDELYIAFVENWDMGLFSEKDKEDWKGQDGQLRNSLQKTVISRLVSAANSLGSASIKRKPFILETVLEYLSELEKNSSPENGARITTFLLKANETIHARNFARSIVRANIDNAYVWCKFGETFDKGSTDRFKCHCRASQCSENTKLNQRCLGCSLNALFEKDQTPICKKTECDIWDDKSIDYKSPEVRTKYAAMADDLAFNDAISADGVILSITQNKLSGEAKMRVWWQTSADPNGDNAFLPLQLIDGHAPESGLPVKIKLLKTDNKEKPVSAAARIAAPWDGYPKMVGIVCDIDRSRGYLQLVSVGGNTYWVDMRKTPELERMELGNFCQFGVLKNRGGKKDILFVSPISRPDGGLDFVKEYSGILEHKNGESGCVADGTSIPRKFCRGVPLGTPVHGTAVLIAGQNQKQSRWQAVSFEKHLR